MLLEIEANYRNIIGTQYQFFNRREPNILLHVNMSCKEDAESIHIMTYNIINQVLLIQLIYAGPDL